MQRIVIPQCFILVTGVCVFSIKYCYVLGAERNVHLVPIAFPSVFQHNGLYVYNFTVKSHLISCIVQLVLMIALYITSRLSRNLRNSFGT